MTLLVDQAATETVHWPSVIRHYRLSMGLKQAALAEDLGVTQTMVSRWEAGRASPSNRIRASLFDLFWSMTATVPRDEWLERISRHPAMISVIDGSGRQLKVSQGLLRAMGVDRTAIEGRLLSESGQSDVLTLFNALQAGGLFEGRIASAESVDCLNFTRSDGSQYRIHVHGLHRPAYMPDGTIAWLGSSAEVTPEVYRELRAALGCPVAIRRAI